MIKAPSEQLLNFSEVKVNMIFKTIKPDAEYLFARVKKLNLLDMSCTKFRTLWPDLLSETGSKFKSSCPELCLSYRDGFETTQLEKELYQLRFGDGKNKDKSKNMNTMWPYLTELLFDDTQFVNFAKFKLFELLPKLEKMIFKNSRIIAVTEDMFAKAVNLRQLEIYDNVSKLDENSFSGMDNLKVLKINAILDKVLDEYGEYDDEDDDEEEEPKAPLKYPNRIYFPSKLEELELVNFEMRSIDLKTFANPPPSLKKLELRSCSIGSIHRNAFDKFTNLETLNIGLSPLRQFETTAAPEHLVLRYNDLVQVKLNASEENVSKIKRVMLISPKNSSGINLTSLHHMDGLTLLSIKPTRDMRFDHFTNLEELSVEVSSLAVLGGGKFKCLAKLKSLYLTIDPYGKWVLKANFF
jgi:hypothetical protein